MARSNRASTAAARSPLDNWTEALKLLTLSPRDGRIWMNDKRMIMLDLASFGEMRAELVRSLGPNAARSALMRIGFASGVRDADLLRERWPSEFQQHAPLGPQFHGLAGVVNVQMLHAYVDPQTGGHHGEYIWHHCAEDDVHIAAHGIGTEPACWMETGYASGFITRISGIPHLFREVSCRSTGSDVCRVLEKPAAAWRDADDDLACLGLLDTDSVPEPGGRDSHELGLLAELSDPEARPEAAIVGESAALKVSLHLLRRAAPTSVSVLVTGESGVGKELFARTLHRLSARKDGPFIAVNCAALPETLLEAELFGVERGAFTGAVRSRAGRFERAHGGTLFLDEVAALNPVSQSKLLRALQEGEIERIGGTQSIATDVRVVAATNADLRRAVDAGQFREDLFFRLNVFPIDLPPLRARRDDIRLLMAAFLRRFNEAHGKNVRGFTLRATQMLLNYAYPGNIRELQNLIERAVILAEDRIDSVHLLTSVDSVPAQVYGPGLDGRLSRARLADAAEPAPDGPGHSAVGHLADLFFAEGVPGTLGLPQLEAELASEVIRRAVAAANGNVSAAARRLGMNRYQLEYRLKKMPGMKLMPRRGSRRRPRA